MFHKVIILMIPMANVGGSLEMCYLYFLVDAVWDYFIHSNLRLNLGPLKHALVSPQYHRVHHSGDSAQFNCNYADRFVLWDHLLGTAYTNYGSYPATGIPGYSSSESRNFLQTHVYDLAYPDRIIWSDFRKFRNRKNVAETG